MKNIFRITAAAFAFLMLCGQVNAGSFEGTFMAAPAALTPTSGASNMSVSTASSRQAIPSSGTPTILVLTNLSVGNGAIVYVALGDSTVTATIGQALAILPGQTAYVIIGANTNIAAVATNSATLNVAPGN